MNRNCKVQSSRFKVQGSRLTLNFELGTRNSRPRRAFTLTELLITIAIITLLAGLGLSALGGATQLAREQRTQAMIDKIDQFIRERHEEYRTRAVPIKMPTAAPYPPFYSLPIYSNKQGGSAQSRANAMLRLTALHALMRMELPDRRTDVVNYSSTPYSPELSGVSSFVSLSTPMFSGASVSFYMPSAALQRTYFRMAVKALGGNPNASTTFTVLDKWTPENENAECLYLIIASMRDGDKQALDYFASDEIGDTDEDGMKEIIDGWGTPITFLRWAPGYCEQPGLDGEPGVINVDDDNNGVTDDVTEYGWTGSDDLQFVVQTFQTRNAARAPDPFDPARVHPRWDPNPKNDPYALFPLILSAGPDRQYDIKLGFTSPPPTTPFRYAVPPSGFPNDPYFDSQGAYSEPQLGTPLDEDGDGELNFTDNLSNHAQQAQ
jgi:prepilin-type N-terminal cleavage/methylation domain-containing protein